MWIMESILIFLVVTLMMTSSPVLGISQSTSCSWVNGQMICEKQTSDGNSAAAFSGAAVGGGQTYQDAYAGAGNPGQWNSGRQTVYGTVPGANGPPPSGNPPGPNYGAPPTGNPPGANYGAPPTGYSSGVYSSSSSSSGNFPPGQAGGFGIATGGGFPMGGGAFAFGGGGAYPAQGGAGGFATSGVFPFGGYPAQQPPAGNPDSPPNQGQNQGFDPMMFVRPFFGGGGVPLAGGFAGGFVPFGRR